jgi:uncharacterized protein
MISDLKVVPPCSRTDGPSPALAVVRAVPGKGRGIFAATALRKGDVILVDPTIELSAGDCAALRPTVIEDYHFAHPDGDELGLMVLGLSSLSNHADEPTALTEYSHTPGVGWLVALRAARDLSAGEEITRRYACPPWFDVEK